MSECRNLSDEEIVTIQQTSARPEAACDEAFRIPWELRSFSIGVAFYESADFSWDAFQELLIDAIDKAADDQRPEHYYARWMEALEALLISRGELALAELDHRTDEILLTPRDATHQHPHAEPVAVSGLDHDDIRHQNHRH
jgi:nitrile hydratase accessory protein